MPVWSPQLDAPDTRKLVPNLLAFINANQQAAVQWAAGNPTPAATGFALVKNSTEGRMHDTFPLLMVVSETVTAQSGTEGEGVVFNVALVFDIEAVGPDADALTDTLKALVYALESMLVNVPLTSLLDGITGMISMVTELGHNIGEVGKLKGSNYRAARVRCAWKMWEMSNG